MVGNLLSFNTELTGIIKQGEELKDLSLPRVFPGSWTCTGRRDAPWLRFESLRARRSPEVSLGCGRGTNVLLSLSSLYVLCW